MALHPLPLLSISEQSTRAKLQPEKPKRSAPGHSNRGRLKSLTAAGTVIGALLGTQTGRNIEITNSFEFALNHDTLEVDHAFLNTRKDQCSPACSRLPNKMKPDKELQSSKYFLPTKCSAGTPLETHPRPTICVSTSSSLLTMRTHSFYNSLQMLQLAKICLWSSTSLQPRLLTTTKRPSLSWPPTRSRQVKLSA